MKFKVLICLFSIGLFLPSCYYNAAVRNKISFEDDLGSVEKSLFRMEQLMLKLPDSDFNINYSIEDDSIEINGGLRIPDSTSYFTKQGLSVFTKTEEQEFRSLAKYLKRNYITAGYFHYESKVCFFIYRQEPNNTFDDSRDIAFAKDENGDIIKNECKILDKVESLLLVSPIDAKVYDNFTLRNPK
jgi:hypothetical protein